MPPNTTSFHACGTRLIDADLKILRNSGKFKEVTKYFSRLVPSRPRRSLFLNFRGAPSSTRTCCSLSIFCIRFEPTSISRTDRSCKPSLGPSSKKLFSITIMSSANEKYKRGRQRGRERKNGKESWEKESQKSQKLKKKKCLGFRSQMNG